MSPTYLKEEQHEALAAVVKAAKNKNEKALGAGVTVDIPASPPIKKVHHEEYPLANRYSPLDLLFVC